MTDSVETDFTHWNAATALRPDYWGMARAVSLVVGVVGVFVAGISAALIYHWPDHTPVVNITNEQPDIPVQVSVEAPEVTVSAVPNTATLGSTQTRTADGTDIRREVTVFHTVPVRLSKRGSWEVISGWQYANSAAPAPNASWCYIEGGQKGLSIYLSRDGTVAPGSSQVARSALGLGATDIRRASRACLWPGEAS